MQDTHLSVGVSRGTQVGERVFHWLQRGTRHAGIPEKFDPEKGAGDTQGVMMSTTAMLSTHVA